MHEEQASTSDASAKAEGATSSLIELLIVLARYKRWVFGLPLAAACLSLLVSLALPNWYAATTRIMPPQQSQSNAVAILGQLGVLSSASQALGLKNPSDIYVAMLKSRTVADRLIERFHLQKVYDERLLVDARKELEHNSAISSTREGVISIEVEDKDPRRAADIANAYVDELRNLTLHLAVSEAGQRRVFFEGQLAKAKQDLTAAEVELKVFTQAAGLVNPQGQVGVSVAAAAALRAQISAKEIQLTAMRSFATESNPDVQRSLEELNGLRAELGKMEKNGHEAKGDVLVPFDKAPSVTLDYIRRFREVKYYETLYEILAKQYEIARIDEAKDATLIQVLDPAVEPERKSKPKRLWIVGITTALAAMLAVLGAIAFDVLRRLRFDPAWSDGLSLVRQLLRPG